MRLDRGLFSYYKILGGTVNEYLKLLNVLFDLGNPLTQYIQHYEELNYPLSYLADGHTRVRRSLDPLETLHLNFKAHNR